MWPITYKSDGFPLSFHAISFLFFKYLICFVLWEKSKFTIPTYYRELRLDTPAFQCFYVGNLTLSMRKPKRFNLFICVVSHNLTLDLSVQSGYFEVVTQKYWATVTLQGNRG